MIVNLHEGTPREGLWIQDPLGSTPLTHLNQRILGTVVNLSEPFYFNAGYVENRQQAANRITLVAFTSLNVGNLSEEVRSEILSLGFHLPSRTMVHEATHGCPSGNPVRLRQLTLPEALHLPPQTRDEHDVIEILDSQDTL